MQWPVPITRGSIHAAHLGTGEPGDWWETGQAEVYRRPGVAAITLKAISYLQNY